MEFASIASLFHFKPRKGEIKDPLTSFYSDFAPVMVWNLFKK